MRGLFLRVMDWDVTWLGLGWLRPRSREASMGVPAILALVAVTSVLTLLAIAAMGAVANLTGVRRAALEGAGAIRFAAAVLLFNAAVQVVSAVFWNQRAGELRSRLPPRAEHRDPVDL